ncbi:hypothetical protein HZH68_002556 [Vespula germanica]|uniref:Headcase middle domain-containing protein n=1 Tax=Vespula germanica TaxID=30212 RepID=A0A834NMI1_VESGE|nr:hypothetical protein HZH68_002556 [Vespula germanica]
MSSSPLHTLEQMRKLAGSDRNKFYALSIYYSLTSGDQWSFDNSVKTSNKSVFKSTLEIPMEPFFTTLPSPFFKPSSLQMEDEGNHGNDDTRCFILSTLAALQWSRVSCVLCRAAMLVFDRYPLVDGTFFLSPRQHSPACAEVKVEGRTQFLSAVCMSCLEGSGNAPVRCRCCTQPWDGSSLVLGTMYSYDIFAAMPCCTERLKEAKCNKGADPKGRFLKDCLEGVMRA